MNMRISKHKLSADFAEFDETNKTSGAFKSGLPDTIVIHYTAGGSAMSAINSFKDTDINASAHIVVDTDGSLTQMVPFHKIAWHAGKSTWLDRKDLNNYSIGIEIVNAAGLNIRSGPGANHDTIAEPLSRNSEVSILEEKDGWYQVEVKMSGWVSKRFVERVG